MPPLHMRWLAAAETNTVCVCDYAPRPARLKNTSQLLARHTHTSRALCARTLPPRAYLLVQASASALSCLMRPCRFLSYTSCTTRGAHP